MKKQFTLLILAVSTFAYSKTFTYEISNTPYKEIETCAREAKVLAKKITDQTSVATVNPRCDWNENFNTTIIQIDYNAEKPLPFVSTTPETFKQVYYGFYATQQDCEKDLSFQENLFQKETGLAILTSFCYVDRPYLKSAYALRIEAVGESKRVPYYTSLFSDSHAVVPKAEEVTQKVKNYLSEKGATLVHMSYRTSMPEDAITLFYYGEKQMEFDRVVLYALPDFRTCQSELSLIEEKLGREGIKTPVAYCGTPFSSSYSADLLVFPEAGLVRVKQSLEKFQDYKTCYESRDVLVQKYQASIGAKVLTGICQRELSGTSFRVALFIKN